MTSPGIPLWSYTTRRADDGATIVALSGDLDFYCADALFALLRGLLEAPGNGHLTADFGAVTFLDSAGLGALIKTYQRAQDLGGEFAIIELTHPVRRILEITGMLEILTLGATSSTA